MPITYHVVVPFGRDDDGNLVPLEPVEGPTPKPQSGAQRATETNTGAAGILPTGDPASGAFSDAKVAKWTPGCSRSEAALSPCGGIVNLP